MSWRETFLQHFGPGGLTGCTLGDWWSLLRLIRFRVDFRYWPRAAAISGNCLSQSLIRGWESLRHGAAIDAVTVPPPLFVLGIWRSGTTHLHNLLSQDDRFSFPTTVQAFYPHTFLTTEASSRSVMRWFIPSTRPMDNVRQGVDEPQEDEFALAASGISFMHGLLTFPRTGNRLRRWLTLNDATPDECNQWKALLLQFVRKLTLRDRRPLILKSPAHTARIRFLLELFPEARFVHIRRHPYDVYQSTLHTWRKVREYWALQRGEVDAEQVIRDYVDIYDAYFDQRDLIPRGRLCEVAYEDLERDPLKTLETIYESLQLPEFAAARPTLQAYIQSLQGYERNRFSPLSIEERARLSQAFRRCFAEWGYAT